MFEVMIADSRSYGARPPEFLMIHPITSTRVADGRNRARQYPARMYTDNPEFHLMRMRVELSFQGQHDDAVGYFRRMRDAGGLVESAGTPCINPFDGSDVRAGIHLPNGFEYTCAEMGSGSSRISADSTMHYEFSDSYGQFSLLHMNQGGVIRH